MLPAGLTAKAIQLCAASMIAAVSPAPQSFPISINAGATLSRQPQSAADAQATVRDLLALGADFEAGPLGINGRDFVPYGVTPASVFDPCAMARVDEYPLVAPIAASPTVPSVGALLQNAFGARITNAIRPMNASYGARNSWHKHGQAIDFVPAGGLLSINREQIRALMAANGIRLLELLGPGDRGHSNHWHVAFARSGQVIDRGDPIEDDEDWIVNVASADKLALASSFGVVARSVPASAPQPAEKTPPQWDVFAAVDWRASHGGGS